MIPQELLKHPESILVLRLLVNKHRILMILSDELEAEDCDAEFLEDLYDGLNRICCSLQHARQYFKNR